MKSSWLTVLLFQTLTVSSRSPLCAVAELQREHNMGAQRRRNSLWDATVLQTAFFYKLRVARGPPGPTVASGPGYVKLLIESRVCLRGGGCGPP
jgi:hypothetical protein